MEVYGSEVGGWFRWKEGKCSGESCSYAHGDQELRHIPAEILSQVESRMHANDREQKGATTSDAPPGQHHLQ